MLAPRRWHIALLSVAVVAAHLWLADQVLPTELGDGAGDGAMGKRPPRIDVAFVRELAPSAPPAVPLQAAAPAPRPRPSARPPPAAASAAAAAEAAEPPAPAASTAVARAELATAEPPAPPPAIDENPPPPLQVAAATSAPAPAMPATATAPADTPTTFDWPPSTRLSYTLSGHYRGPVEGQAHVEWLRSGTHYQVRMDVSVGPSFAPLMSRRVSSDGEITAQGLSPRRYDEETKVVLRNARRVTIVMDPEHVLLPDGSQLPRPDGLQDSASQFVQLTWLFTTQPQLLQTGRSVDFALALPRRVQKWTYDVLGTETLATPAGAVDTVHVKPRREPRPNGEQRASDLTAEMWVAPSLQYLPVRIVIRQDEQTYIDMLIERLPQQAAAPPKAAGNAVNVR